MRHTFLFSWILYFLLFPQSDSVHFRNCWLQPKGCNSLACGCFGLVSNCSVKAKETKWGCDIFWNFHNKTPHADSFKLTATICRKQINTLMLPTARTNQSMEKKPTPEPVEEMSCSFVVLKDSKRKERPRHHSWPLTPSPPSQSCKLTKKKVQTNNLLLGFPGLPEWIWRGPLREDRGSVWSVL